MTEPAESAEDTRTLSEKIQDVLSDFYGPRGNMVTCFYLMVEGIDSANGEEWWQEAFPPGAPIRRRLALVEWSRAVVQSDAKDYVETIAAMSHFTDEDDDE